MGELKRLSPEETRRRVLSGAALLVCAYEDDVKFGTMSLEGAISLSDFKKRQPSLSKEQEIIFY